MTKELAQQQHFTKRCIQRIGKIISNETVSKMIQSNQTIQSKKLTNRVTEHIISYDGNMLKIVYDKQRNQCVTVLPIDMFTISSCPF